MGCIMVLIAIGFLMWLPATPWLAIKTPTSTTLTRSHYLTGYEVVAMIDAAYIAAPSISRLSEHTEIILKQQHLSDLLNPWITAQSQFAQLISTVEPYMDYILLAQFLFISLSLSVVALALLVMFSFSTTIWQVMRGLTLALVTLLTVGMTIGGIYFLSAKLDEWLRSLSAVAVSGGYEFQNMINLRMALAAGLAALFGAGAAVLGAYLSATQAWLPPMPNYVPNPTNVMESQIDQQISKPQQTLLKTLRLAKNCGKCGQTIPANSRFCRYCGNKIE